jgi:starch-binding outer membrane protein, SusD/RagB family
MKTRYISIFVLFLSGILAFTSCLKDLDTIPLDENVITSATFYNDPASYEMVLAKLYGGLSLTGQVGPDGDQDVLGVDEGASNYIRAFWYMQDITTEMALWVWNDPGIPEMQTNTWTPSNEVNLGMYSRIYYQITLANELIRESTPEKLNERGFSENIKSEIAMYHAEARLLRALSYYHALDLYGSVPFVTEEDPVGAFLA